MCFDEPKASRGAALPPGSEVSVCVTTMHCQILDGAFKATTRADLPVANAHVLFTIFLLNLALITRGVCIVPLLL